MTLKLTNIFTNLRNKVAQAKAIRQRKKADPAFKANDDQRVAVEKAYAKKTFKQRWALTGEYAQERSYSLKWRLNWALLIVGFLIAGTYIVLFFA